MTTTTHIAIAGFQHETNTFGATKADIPQFEMADSWPGLLTGDAVSPGLYGMNIPLAGFIDASSQDNDIRLTPILWCAAEPSAHVTTSAFEAISEKIISGIRNAIHTNGTLDAVYLDLHGAMVTETYDDGEGELLRRIRADLADQGLDDIPLIISLDLHANITAAMINHTTAMTIFRTYPHLDMAEGGARAYRLLRRVLGGWHPCKAWRQVPLLLPLHAQFTGKGAGADLYDAIRDNNVDAPVVMDIALGFTAADTPHTGPAIVAYADDQHTAEDAADHIYNHFMALTDAFRTPLLSAQDGVMKAMGFLGQGPQVIADVQDNAGAGGSADTTGVLRAMLNAGVTAGVVGIMTDPLLAAQCHDMGEGSIVFGTMGGNSGHPDDTPLEGMFQILRLSDGTIPATGEMYGGSTAELGPSALVRVLHDRAEVDVVVSSHRIQCLDQAFLRHFGVDLETRSVIALKSTVHYRADFDPICPTPINVAAPGLFPCAWDGVNYKNLRQNIKKL